jgi:hypothetical protein
MPGPSVDIGRDLVCFVDPQTAFKTPAGFFPVAADALRLLGASTTGKPVFSAYEDKRGTGTAQGIVQEKSDASLTLDFYAYTPSAGTAPDWWDILLYGGWQQQAGPAATEVKGATSTTTVIALDTAAGITVGGCCEISGELRRITVVDAVSNPNTITVTPALSSIPAEDTVVTFGIAAYPKDARATTPDALTVWVGNNRSLERFTGWAPATMSLQNPGTGAAKWSVTGPARERRLLYSTNLTAGINDAVTTIPVEDGTACPADASATNPYYFTIGTEVLEIIAVSGNNWTCSARGVYAHGGAAASHSSADEVFPAIPTGTYSGSPVACTSGQIIANGDDMDMDDASLECDMGILPREDEYGDKQKMAGYVCGARVIKPSCAGSSYYDQAGVRVQEASNRTAIQLFAQRGGTSGAIIAWEAPAARLEMSDYDRSADEVQISLAGQAFGTSAKQDEVYIMVA